MKRRQIALLWLAAALPTAMVCAGEPARTNLALHRPATGSAICKPGEEAQKAVNGLLASKTHDKFCSLQRPAWLRVDLQAERELRGFTVKHAQAGGEAAAMNTRAFALSVSGDGATWRQVVKVDDNVDGVSVHRIAPTRARYVRLDIAQPAQDPADPATRIYELEAW
ncbi:F5/8 type C domain protein [Lysobacter antibioticus]|uniref:discoidin domain-containing protein n=1 Tax=Lysobacter antibioticus TaxID=84531 RepID=UPI0007170E12|nr:discoidin domain-containing protein [Lysobacter antibioticus]ALN64299.1 F5/8 type C domain protein [Lysobacter antibioticus]